MSNPVQGEPRAAVPYRLVDDHHTMPALEPWLKVMMAALVPAISIMFVPDALQRPMAAAAGALMVIGAVMMIVARARRMRGA